MLYDDVSIMPDAMPQALPDPGDQARCNVLNARTALTQMCSTSAESSRNASPAGGLSEFDVDGCQHGYNCPEPPAYIDVIADEQACCDHHDDAGQCLGHPFCIDHTAFARRNANASSVRSLRLEQAQR